MDVLDDLRARSSQFLWSPKASIKHIAGRGNSVVCADPLGPSELIIHVPASMLLNISTVVSSDGAALSPHELLALELLKRREKGDDPWVQTLPSEFGTMPVSWSDEQQQLLPQRYLKRVEEQAREIRDFASKCQLQAEAADWAWKAVNTRCLYWHKGGMTLAPAIDYLNHTCTSDNSALLVKPTHQGISVFTQRAYEPGEELTFCYGPHENGFLLVEYGFLVPNNPWNFVDISESVGPLVETRREWLMENNYWGDWTIDAAGQPSFRVEVALASVQADNTRMLNALIGGYDDGSRYATKTQDILKSVASELITRYRGLCSKRGISNDLLALYTELVAILTRV